MVQGTVSSVGLPPGWQEVRAEGKVYYWHPATNVTQYERPTEETKAENKFGYLGNTGRRLIISARMMRTERRSTKRRLRTRTVKGKVWGRRISGTGRRRVERISEKDTRLACARRRG